MKPCPEYLDELALAAGGDLPVEEERLVLTHAEACEGCQSLLIGLMGNQAALARVARVREPFESLAPAVMARVATESHVAAAQRVALAGSTSVRGLTPRPALVPFLRIAAAVVLVASAGLFGMAVLHQQVRDETDPSGLTSPEAGPQVAVRRLPGEAIEVSWAGDGREGAEIGAGKPYRVLASADPRNFSGAKEVEVAGRRLVTDLPLPAARAQD